MYENIRYSSNQNKDKIIFRENETGTEPEHIETYQQGNIYINQCRAKTKPKFIKIITLRCQEFVVNIYDYLFKTMDNDHREVLVSH